MVRCLATLALRQPCRVQAQNSCGLGSSPLHTVGVSLRFEPVGHQSGKKLLQQFVAETNYERKFFFVGALMEKMLLKIPLPSNTFRHQKFFEVRVWFCALGVFSTTASTPSACRISGSRSFQSVTGVFGRFLFELVCFGHALAGSASRCGIFGYRCTQWSADYSVLGRLGRYAVYVVTN